MGAMAASRLISCENFFKLPISSRKKMHVTMAATAPARSASTVGGRGGAQARSKSPVLLTFSWSICLFYLGIFLSSTIEPSFAALFYFGNKGTTPSPSARPFDVASAAAGFASGKREINGHMQHDQHRYNPLSDQEVGPPLISEAAGCGASSSIPVDQSAGIVAARTTTTSKEDISGSAANGHQLSAPVPEVTTDFSRNSSQPGPDPSSTNSHSRQTSRDSQKSGGNNSVGSSGGGGNRSDDEEEQDGENAIKTAVCGLFTGCCLTNLTSPTSQDNYYGQGHAHGPRSRSLPDCMDSGCYLQLCGEEDIEQDGAEESDNSRRSSSAAANKREEIQTKKWPPLFGGAATAARQRAQMPTAARPLSQADEDDIHGVASNGGARNNSSTPTRRGSGFGFGGGSLPTLAQYKSSWQTQYGSRLRSCSSAFGGGVVQHKRFVLNPLQQILNEQEEARKAKLLEEQQNAGAQTVVGSTAAALGPPVLGGQLQQVQQPLQGNVDRIQHGAAAGAPPGGAQGHQLISAVDQQKIAQDNLINLYWQRVETGAGGDCFFSSVLRIFLIAWKQQQKERIRQEEIQALYGSSSSSAARSVSSPEFFSKNVTPTTTTVGHTAGAAASSSLVPPSAGELQKATGAAVFLPAGAVPQPHYQTLHFGITPRGNPNPASSTTPSSSTLLPHQQQQPPQLSASEVEETPRDKAARLRTEYENDLEQLAYKAFRLQHFDVTKMLKKVRTLIAVQKLQADWLQQQRINAIRREREEGKARGEYNAKLDYSSGSVVTNNTRFHFYDNQGSTLEIVQKAFCGTTSNRSGSTVGSSSGKRMNYLLGDAFCARAAALWSPVAKVLTKGTTGRSSGEDQESGLEKSFLELENNEPGRGSCGDEEQQAKEGATSSSATPAGAPTCKTPSEQATFVEKKSSAAASSAEAGFLIREQTPSTKCTDNMQDDCSVDEGAEQKSKFYRELHPLQLPPDERRAREDQQQQREIMAERDAQIGFYCGTQGLRDAQRVAEEQKMTAQQDDKSTSSPILNNCSPSNFPEYEQLPPIDPNNLPEIPDVDTHSMVTISELREALLQQSRSTTRPRLEEQEDELLRKKEVLKQKKRAATPTNRFSLVPTKILKEEEKFHKEVKDFEYNQNEYRSTMRRLKRKEDDGYAWDPEVRLAAELFNVAILVYGPHFGHCAPSTWNVVGGKRFDTNLNTILTDETQVIFPLFWNGVNHYQAILPTVARFDLEGIQREVGRLEELYAVDRERSCGENVVGAGVGGSSSTPLAPGVVAAPGFLPGALQPPEGGQQEGQQLQVEGTSQGGAPHHQGQYSTITGAAAHGGPEDAATGAPVADIVDPVARARSQSEASGRAGGSQANTPPSPAFLHRSGDLRWLGEVKYQAVSPIGDRDRDDRDLDVRYGNGGSPQSRTPTRCGAGLRKGCGYSQRGRTSRNSRSHGRGRGRDGAVSDSGSEGTNNSQSRSQEMYCDDYFFTAVDHCDRLSKKFSKMWRRCFPKSGGSSCCDGSRNNRSTSSSNHRGDNQDRSTRRTTKTATTTGSRCCSRDDRTSGSSEGGGTSSPAASPCDSRPQEDEDHASAHKCRDCYAGAVAAATDTRTTSDDGQEGDEGEEKITFAQFCKREKGTGTGTARHNKSSEETRNNYQSQEARNDREPCCTSACFCSALQEEFGMLCCGDDTTGVLRANKETRTHKWFYEEDLTYSLQGVRRSGLDLEDRQHLPFDDYYSYSPTEKGGGLYGGTSSGATARPNLGYSSGGLSSSSYRRTTLPSSGTSRARTRSGRSRAGRGKRPM
ncbi:unnamed protein product [Amoebophrya sp. A120]|nr:unnamed protein product [Amoebophrya sp. A120]|eukprot:GSA120T00022004001.1